MNLEKFTQLKNKFNLKATDVDYVYSTPNSNYEIAFRSNGHVLVLHKEGVVYDSDQYVEMEQFLDLILHNNDRK